MLQYLQLGSRVRAPLPAFSVKYSAYEGKGWFSWLVVGDIIRYGGIRVAPVASSLV